MEKLGSVIGRPSEYSNLVAELRSYLTEARADPSLPLSILAICRSKGLSKSTLYNHQYKPEVVEILHEIRSLAKARKLAARHVDGLNDIDAGEVGLTHSEESLGFVDAGGQPAAVELELLAVRAAEVVRRAVWSMRRFMGRHRKHRYVSDLPRVVYDLDVALGELHRIRGELGSLSDEWRGGAHNDSEIVSAGNQLSLASVYEE